MLIGERNIYRRTFPSYREVALLNINKPLVVAILVCWDNLPSRRFENHKRCHLQYIYFFKTFNSIFITVVGFEF